MGQVKSLVVPGERDEALEFWGERAKMRELATRIRTMLPYGAILEDNEALALAQAAYVTRLNPFEGEIYFLKSEKTGEAKGVYTGIKGRRRKAREQLQKQIGKGANFWIEYEWPNAEWKQANSYPADWLVCKAVLRDTATINEYVKIVTALVSAKMSNTDIKAVAGDRPFIEGVGFVKPNESLTRPRVEVAKKRAERAALAQRFDIGIVDEQHDDDEDESGAEVDHGPDWTYIENATRAPLTLEHGRQAMGRDNGDLIGASELSDQPDDSLAHVVKDEQPAPETKPEAPNGKPPKLAILKTPHFPDLVKSVSAKTKHYRDGAHMQAAAVKLKFYEINDGNLKAITDALIQYGIEQDALKNAPAQ